jgi:hypothetical protein
MHPTFEIHIYNAFLKIICTPPFFNKTAEIMQYGSDAIALMGNCVKVHVPKPSHPVIAAPGRKRKIQAAVLTAWAFLACALLARMYQDARNGFQSEVLSFGSMGATSPFYPCAFDYPGPILKEDLNCFLEYFPNSAPISYAQFVASSRKSSPAGQRRFHTLSGVRWENGPPPVPIFIIFKDRVSVFLEMLRSLYRYLRTPFEIVIIHDNSTYPAATHFIDRLKDSGVYVFENTRPWKDFDEFYEMVADCVERYMAHSISTCYVLSDPDCAIDSVPGNMLTVYQGALEDLGLDVVGAALRWDDFPEGLNGASYEDKVAQLPAHTYTFKGRNYFYVKAQIDTTFAMYRKGPRLSRFAGKHIRMLPPLGARHLDFYLDKAHLPPDYKHYHNDAREKEVNHMSHLD